MIWLLKPDQTEATEFEPAMVPSPSDLPTFVTSVANRGLLSSDLRPGKPPEGKLDGGEGNEGGQGFGKVFEVLGETPVSSEPGAAALLPPQLQLARRCSRHQPPD